MNIDWQIPVSGQPPFPLKIVHLIGSVYHINLQEWGFPTDQVCYNKDQFKAALSAQPHKGGMQNMFFNISPSIM
jgi:hypothetical protein